MPLANSKKVLLGVALFAGIGSAGMADADYSSQKSALTSMVEADGFIYSADGSQILPVYGELNLNKKSSRVTGVVSSENGQEYQFVGKLKGSHTIEGFDQSGSFVALEID